MSIQYNHSILYSNHQLFITTSASTRFVKCDKCARFFVILSENDLHKNAKEHAANANSSPHFQKSAEKFNIQRNPPPPKKVGVGGGVGNLQPYLTSKASYLSM